MSTHENAGHPLSFEGLVEKFYRSLYQFGLSLTGSESDAGDLTQQTFFAWAKKGHQLRDGSKVKTWLFTTLHREFLKTRRRQTRFPHQELDAVEQELPVVSPAMVNELDGAEVMTGLQRISELYRAPVAMFYLEDLSYKEIADVLDVPIGTVQSRIARGKGELRQLFLQKEHSG